MSAIKEKMDNLESELRQPIKEYLKSVSKQLKDQGKKHISILRELYYGQSYTTVLDLNGNIRKVSIVYDRKLPDESYSIDEFVDRMDLSLMKRIVDNLVKRGYKK